MLTCALMTSLHIQANMMGSFVIPPVVELLRLQRHWKWAIMVLLLMTAAGVAVFTYLVYDLYEPPPPSNHTNTTTTTTAAVNGYRGGMTTSNTNDEFGPASAPATNAAALLPPLSLTSSEAAFGLGTEPATTTTTRGLIPIGIAFCVTNFAYGGIAVLGLELASELVFPVSEESAAAYMTVMYQVLNIGLMEAGNVKVMSHLKFNILTAGLFGLCSLLVLPVVSLNSRQKMDAKER